MGKDLERNLGLYAVFTVSVGAMIGSGIFVLPGLAFDIAGPSVILAYLLAGLVVFPAALSKSEMATAMPSAGGTYLYIDRAMGPLFGTVAGLGTWFSLVFKSAFALVGLGAYLLLFAPVAGAYVKLVALALGALVVGVNLVGVKQTGRLQASIVTVVLLVLVVYIGDGLTYVDQVRFHPFFPNGGGGLLTATAFVFVSYAGVTKIASVAEEVEDPGRNIPIGMLASMTVMMLVYTFVVFVIVGVTDPAELRGTYTPMAAGAEQFLGTAGDVLVVAVAVLALTSMANAGVLSSSRYPLAMSRDALAPPSLSAVSDRFKTPTPAILLTGGVLLALIAFVPVVDLAKLASAFKILVFSMVNVALVVLRESDADWYQPEFRSPGYPWVQLFGIVGGVVLLIQFGTVPLLGALGIILGGLVWYRLYARERTDREGAAVEELRERTDTRILDHTRDAVAEDGDYRILVPVRSDAPVGRVESLLRTAAPVARRRGGELRVIRFDEVPDQLPLLSVEQTEADTAFERETRTVADALDVPVTVGEIGTHDARRAIVNYADHEDIDLVIGERQVRPDHATLFGDDANWLLRHAPCDVAFVQHPGEPDVDEIAVVAHGGWHDPMEVLLADAIATEADATVKFLYLLPPDAPEAQRTALAEYHEGLVELCSAPAETVVIQDANGVAMLEMAANAADLVVTRATVRRPVRDAMLDSGFQHVARNLDGTVLFVRSHRHRRHTFLGDLLRRVAY